MFLSVLISIATSFVSCTMEDNGSGKETSCPELVAWTAGTTVTDDEIADFGIQRCFVSELISDSVFQVMKGKSYKDNCTVPRGDLRYVKVLHRNLKGENVLGELVCNKEIASDLLDIFRELYDARYPIERMVLIDNYNAEDDPSMIANNSSCFNFRFVAGTKSLSKHSRGMAIDINPLYNPYVKRTQSGSIDISPRIGSPYANRNKSFNYKIDKNDLCYKLFIAHGFKWGGDWSTVKDYQHFEK